VGYVRATHRAVASPRATAVAAFVFFAFAATSSPAGATEVRVAVAANFSRPMEAIAREFQKETGHEAVLVSGATGTFFAQIESGAPFDLLLAADRTTPERLEAEGFTEPSTRVTYAVGVLALWSAKAGLVDSEGLVLKKGAFAHLAMANPKLAPYGMAATETLATLGLTETLRPKIVLGESVAQALQLVASGNAELGFVALSQVAAPEAALSGSYWVVPAAMHRPIEQQAVVLRHGVANAAAHALLTFLHGPKARDIIRAYHYDLPPAAP
jgi:molybdate transport system substrate-binding protein